MLMEAGVPLATALNLGISGSKNLAVREALIEAEESLLSGHGLTDALVRCPVLPRMFVELVRIGEETNSLQRTMDDAAESYEKDFERSIDTFVGVLEPASTLAVGLIVGFIAFSMFVPIYSSLSALD
ncbi:MAG: type II secretion system F family protein [Chloroflexi bacterium]|nr:type II secretion system F family protein [Chloroflexota bacterium]